MQGKYEFLSPAGGQVVGTPNALIDAALEVQTADVRHLERIEVLLEQVADAGTVVIVTERSMDGVTWQTVDASTTEAEFPAGANTCVSFTLSDSNGMPIVCNFVRARCTALAGGGTYRMKVAGQTRPGY